MRRTLPLVLALVIAAGVLLLPAGPAGSVTVTATGWWTRNPAASAPSEGMAVGVVPDGSATAAALKVHLGDGVRSATLELTEAGGVATDAANVLACETSTTWLPVEKGAFDAAPTTRCDEARSVVLLRDADTGTWSADVSQLVAGRTGVASIALVARPADGIGRLAFEVRWSGPPTFTSTPAAPPSSVPTTVAPAAGPAPTPAPTARAASPPATSSPPPTLALPPVSVPEPEIAAAAGQSTTSSVPTTSPPFAPALPASASGVPVDPPWEQLIFFVVVAAVAGVLAGAGRWYSTRR